MLARFFGPFLDYRHRQQRVGFSQSWKAEIGENLPVDFVSENPGDLSLAAFCYKNSSCPRNQGGNPHPLSSMPGH